MSTIISNVGAGKLANGLCLLPFVPMQYPMRWLAAGVKMQEDPKQRHRVDGADEKSEGEELSYELIYFIEVHAPGHVQKRRDIGETHKRKCVDT